MDRVYALGKLGSLKVTADNTALIGLIPVLIVLALIGSLVCKFVGFELIVFVVTAAFLYYFSELLHQSGHAQAARMTGYPMIGVHFYTILSRSIYPADEKNVPAAVHVRRALGGPIMSLLLALAFGLMTLIAQSLNLSGLPLTILAYGCLLNLLFYGLGAFLPLGFTDGSTLLYWLPKLRADRLKS